MFRLELLLYPVPERVHEWDCKYGVNSATNDQNELARTTFPSNPSSFNEMKAGKGHLSRGFFAKTFSLSKQLGLSRRQRHNVKICVGDAKRLGGDLTFTTRRSFGTSMHD